MAGGKHILGKAKRHIFGTAKVGEKGQIVIPKDARQIFGVKPGDTLLILGDEETGIIVTKPDVLRDAADEMYYRVNERYGIYEQDDRFVYNDAVDMDTIPKNFDIRHLYHPLDLWRIQVLKQADVVLLQFQTEFMQKRPSCASTKLPRCA